MPARPANSRASNAAPARHAGRERPRQPRIGDRPEPAGRPPGGEPEPQHLEQHDLREMVGHQVPPGALSRSSAASCSSAQRRIAAWLVASRTCTMAAARRTEGRPERLEEEPPADQEEGAAAVAGRDSVGRPVVDRGRIDRRQSGIGGEAERPPAGQQETVAGRDPDRLGLALHRHPAGAAHHRVELDPVMGGEADRPGAAGIEPALSTLRGLSRDSTSESGSMATTGRPRRIRGRRSMERPAPRVDHPGDTAALLRRRGAGP